MFGNLDTVDFKFGNNQVLKIYKGTEFFWEPILTPIYSNDTNPFNDGSLIAKYELENNILDTTGNYNGTSNTCTFTAGNFGDCANFNNSQGIILPSSFTVSNVRTVSAWIYKTSHTDYDTIISFGKGGSSNSYSWLTLIITNTGILTFEYGGDIGTPASGISSNSVIPLNKWVHIVAIASGDISSNSGFKLYIDNVEDTGVLGTGTGYSPQQGNSKIGIYAAQDIHGFNGLIDQVEIYDKPLNDTEISQLFNMEDTVWW